VTEIAYWLLLILGAFMLIANLLMASKAGKPRSNPNYPAGSYYVLDALIGVALILVALGII
jgi:hypothetical protein